MNDDKLNIIQLTNMLDGAETTKNKVVLSNTYMDAVSFINYMGVNGKRGCPHFTVTKTGLIYQHLQANWTPKTSDDTNIYIALENLGFLTEDEGVYRDVFGNILDGASVLERVWKDKRHWDIYTDGQYQSVVSLVVYLCKSEGVKRVVSEDNTYHNDLSDYGVVYRSNTNQLYYDLSPAWEFERFKFDIENELF